MDDHDLPAGWERYAYHWRTTDKTCRVYRSNFGEEYRAYVGPPNLGNKGIALPTLHAAIMAAEMLRDH